VVQCACEVRRSGLAMHRGSLGTEGMRQSSPGRRGHRVKTAKELLGMEGRRYRWWSPRLRDEERRSGRGTLVSRSPASVNRSSTSVSRPPATVSRLPTSVGLAAHERQPPSHECQPAPHERWTALPRVSAGFPRALDRPPTSVSRSPTSVGPPSHECQPVSHECCTGFPRVLGRRPTSVSRLPTSVYGLPTSVRVPPHECRARSREYLRAGDQAQFGRRQEGSGWRRWLRRRRPCQRVGEPGNLARQPR
jgi:hypothetical protein